MRPALPLATALASAFLALACVSAPSDPVRATLLALEEAGEARDADRFASHLASTFRGAGTGLVGLDKAAASAALRRYFAAYESVSLTVHEPEIERRESGARVRCAVEFSGKASAAFGLGGLLPADVVYHFELDLTEEGGVLKVAQASWEPAGPPAPAP